MTYHGGRASYTRRELEIMKAQHTGPLPEGWTLKDGFINYQEDDYHKYILDKSGRIDRNAVALTLENYGYPDHARRWFLSPAEMAARELLEACRELYEIIESLTLGTITPPERYRETSRALHIARAAIEKAEAQP